MAGEFILESVIVSSVIPFHSYPIFSQNWESCFKKFACIHSIICDNSENFHGGLKNVLIIASWQLPR